jgi:ATP-dependent RNA helicase RhlE
MTREVPSGSFAELGLDLALLRAVEAAGFAEPTAVQRAAIPAVLAGRDLRARAHTGSGKTAAFGLPLLQRLCAQPRARAARGNEVAVLVLVPTRELATQIAEALAGFASQLPVRLRVLAVFGGVSINPQMMALRGGADVVVATPGRLLDLHRHNALRLDATRTVVLDEADRLLGLGFADELDEVFDLLPSQRQTLLFSATFPDELDALVRARLHGPVEVEPAAEAGGEPQIEEHVYTVSESRKAALLLQLIEQRDLQQVLVFVSMKKTGESLVAKLQRAGLRAAVFHADRSQAERTRGLAEFRAGKLRVLVATDLAGRGIDIEDLPVVVNFELPRSPNDYVHRIGRTGRAGKPGVALSLICPAEYQHFGVIERRIKRRLAKESVPGFEP